MAMTLDELGAKAGVSPATVSRVLNGSGPVSHNVKQTVMRVVEESGYIPRRLRRRANGAAGLKVGGTGLVEVILHRWSSMERLQPGEHGLQLLPSTKVTGNSVLSKSYSLSSDFYMHIISGIMDELSVVGQKAILHVSDDLGDARMLGDVGLPSKRGVILLGEYSDDLGQFIDACKCPLVLVDIIHAGRPDVVTIDNLAGISQAFDHLYELGHRDIGYVGAPYNVSFRERRSTFEWKMAGAGLTIDPQWMYQGSEHIEDTALGVADILQLPTRPTAFVCSNDFAAMGVLRAAERCGISVPRDLSVIGFDDVDGAVMVTPPLTTMRVPMRQMGQQAVRQLMIGELFETESRGCTIRMAPELVVRQSTMARE